jgi:hypothetical protein
MACFWQLEGAIPLGDLQSKMASHVFVGVGSADKHLPAGRRCDSDAHRGK